MRLTDCNFKTPLPVTEVDRTGDETFVGKEYVIEVGQPKPVMRPDGQVTLTGVRFSLEASGPIQDIGKVQ